MAEADNKQPIVCAAEQSRALRSWVATGYREGIEERGGKAWVGSGHSLGTALGGRGSPCQNQALPSGLFIHTLFGTQNTGNPDQFLIAKAGQPQARVVPSSSNS